MSFFRKHIIILFFLIFPAVCYLMYNAAANIHSHTYKGKIITHAHPFPKDAESRTPLKTHNHSDLTFFLLDKVFYFFFFVVCALGSVAYFALTLKYGVFHFSQVPARNIFLKYTNLRAPPIQF